MWPKLDICEVKSIRLVFIRFYPRKRKERTLEKEKND